MDMDVVLLEVVLFKNEKGNVIEQKVLYVLKPTIWKFCKKYGHFEEVCRKKNPPKPIQQEKEEQHENEQKGSHENPEKQLTGQNKERPLNVEKMYANQSVPPKTNGTNGGWITPMKTWRSQQAKDQNQ